jgi:hypothetical protein
LNLPWREMLASWPPEWRLAFGLEANALADEGVPFPLDERQAFKNVLARRERGEQPPTLGELPCRTAIDAGRAVFALANRHVVEVDLKKGFPRGSTLFCQEGDERWSPVTPEMMKAAEKRRAS